MNKKKTFTFTFCNAFRCDVLAATIVTRLNGNYVTFERIMSLLTHVSFKSATTC